MFFTRGSSVTSFEGAPQNIDRRGSISRGSSVGSFESGGGIKFHSLPDVEHGSRDGADGVSSGHFPDLKNNKKHRKSFTEMLNDFITSEDMPVVELPESYKFDLGLEEEWEIDARENNQRNAESIDIEKNEQVAEHEVEVSSIDKPGKMSEHEQPVVSTPPHAKKAFHERHHFEFAVIVMGGAALAFNAGFVNGCTFQLGGTFVSHITGATTRAGVSLGIHDYDAFAIYFFLISCFIFGAFISGYMMRQETFQLGREYGPLFLIGSALFALDCLTVYYAPDTDLYFYFAAMGCGLQNGLTTKYSGSIIRTTHMTGAGTDIGLVLGRIAQGDTKEKWKLFVLIPLLLMFMLGGLTSVFAVRRFGKLSLLINVFLFLSIGVAYSLVVGQELHIPFWRALFGLYVVAEKKAKKAIKQVVRTVKTPTTATTEVTSSEGEVAMVPTN